MEILDYVRILRRRWLLVASSAALALGMAVLVTARTAPQYAASTTLIVSAPGDAGNPVSAYQAILLSQERAKSYAKLLRSQSVTGRLAASLDDGLTAADLRSRIDAEALPDTFLVRATVRDGSPVRAQGIANALGPEFSRFVDALERPSGPGHAAVKITVADGADLPVVPLSPRPLRNVALGLLVGLVIGALAAVLRESLDTAVRSAQDLREASGSATLGAIGFERRAAERPLIVQDGGSPGAESFRSLRTSLQFIGSDRPPPSVAITSSVVEEGKSTIACNLAITLAEVGWRVILVEADLRHPRIADYLGIQARGGLTGVLRGADPLDDALQQWGSSTLSVLPSGPVPANPSDLLAARAMPRILRELEERADIVLVDTPPLLYVTDASILARACGGTVLVARCDKTRREQVAGAVERLKAVDAGLIGTVLNFASARESERYALGYGHAPKTRHSRITRRSAQQA